MQTQRGLLRPNLAAERAGSAVAALGAVHLNALTAPAQLLCATNDRLIFERHILRVLCADLLQHRVEVTGKLAPACTGYAVFPLPLLAHWLRNRNGGHPVHGGATTNRAAGKDRDVGIGGGGEARVKIEAFVGVALLGREGLFGVEPTRFNDQHLATGGGEVTRNASAARARTNHQNVNGDALGRAWVEGGDLCDVGRSLVWCGVVADAAEACPYQRVGRLISIRVGDEREEFAEDGGAAAEHCYGMLHPAAQELVPLRCLQRAKSREASANEQTPNTGVEKVKHQAQLTVEGGINNLGDRRLRGGGTCSSSASDETFRQGSKGSALGVAKDARCGRRRWRWNGSLSGSHAAYLASLCVRRLTVARRWGTIGTVGAWPSGKAPASGAGDPRFES